ncbi:hypothetical protein J6590_071911 [Homalodisca vitripennis]|nr:hypothetical protein J6590_071911 [Homalodisca vitripennis]
MHDKAWVHFLLSGHQVDFGYYGNAYDSGPVGIKNVPKVETGRALWARRGSRYTLERN